MMRPELREVDRDHIIHVIPDLCVSGCYTTALIIAQQLQKQYAHTLVYETPPDELSPEIIWHAQSAGLQTLQTYRIIEETLDNREYTVAILYNVEGHPNIGKVLPTIYYSYGYYDSCPGETVVSCCSSYACRERRWDHYPDKRILDPTHVISPLINTRVLRRLKVPPHPFTLGIITSGAYNKYPSRMVIRLLSELPGDIRIMLSSLDKYPHPGVHFAIEERHKRYPRRIAKCPVRPNGTIPYLTPIDALLYASNEGHKEPYGRTVIEAMALGKPVICERRGVFAEMLKHGVNALLYDTIEEAIDYVTTIRENTDMANQLGTNAQMWASWQDMTVHIGKLKRTLRMIGG